MILVNSLIFKANLPIIIWKDQGLVDIVVAAALPGSTALFGEELDALFDDARNDRNVGTNNSAQIVRFYFNL